MSSQTTSSSASQMAPASNWSNTDTNDQSEPVVQGESAESQFRSWDDPSIPSEAQVDDAQVEQGPASDNDDDQNQDLCEPTASNAPTGEYDSQGDDGANEGDADNDDTW